MSNNQPDPLQPTDWRDELRQQTSSNEEEFLTLKKAGELIFKAKALPSNPRPEFQEQLKQQILAKQRQQTNFMTKFIEQIRAAAAAFSRPQVWRPVTALAMVVVLLGGGVYFYFSGQSPFKGFSRLLISGANAQDNFSLKPLSADSLGVVGGSGYVLTSKESVATKLIKENLKLSPEVAYKIKEISDREWQILPAAEVAPNTILKFALDTSYVDESTGTQKERDYSWAYQIKDSFKVLNSIPRDTGTQVPVNTGIEVTFSHENFSDQFANYFSIKPQVAGKFERHGRTLVFVPAKTLASGQLYTVTVKQGLPLNGSDEVLAKDYVVNFETENPNGLYLGEQRLYFYSKLVDVTTAERLQQKLYSNQENIGQVKAVVYSFASWQNYLQALEDRDQLPWWSASKNDYRVDVSKLRLVKEYNLPIKSDSANGRKGDGYLYVEFPESFTRGFYIIEYRLNDKVQDQVWVQATDLMAYLNAAKNSSIVWVNNAGSKAPVSGAKVSVVDLTSDTTTNAEGVATFSTPTELIDKASDRKESKRYYLHVSAGADQLIIPASPVASGYNYYDGGSSSADNYWRYLYSDRPRYQPTDTIKFWGLLKEREGQVGEAEVKVALYKAGYVDYYYQPVRVNEQTVKLSELGIFEGSFELQNMKPDYYTLELTVDGKVITTKYINVEPYVKPAYQLTLTPDKHYEFVGEKIKLTGQASFFEGTPVPNLKLVLETPQGKKEATTDENGKVYFDYSIPYHDCQEAYQCWPDYAWLQLKPQNSELGEISSETSLTFYGPQIYLASQSVKYPERGVAEVSLQTKKIDLANLEAGNSWQGQDWLGQTVAPGSRIEGDLIKITYTKKETGTYYDFLTKRTYKNYSYDRKEEKVETVKILTDGEGKYTYRRNIEPETSYQLKLKYYDTQGRYDSTTVWLYYFNGSGVNYYNEGNFNYYHFSFPQDKTSYQIGEEVTARFLNNEELLPAGSKKFLFLQMQNGLQEYSVADSAEYRFAFEERDVPNVNLVGVYFNGSRYIVTQSGFYGQAISFNNKDRRLNLEIKTNKDKYTPGEEVTLEVLATDLAGRPVETAVNLNLIDEAYYAVASDVASPLDSIYASVGAGSIYSAASHTSLDVQMFGGAEKGGCFTGDTLITLVGGKQKPISQIKVGDQILTFHDPLNQEKVGGLVTEVYQHVVNGYLVINNELKVTTQHLVYSGNQFKEAGSLQLGDWLLNSEGKKVYIKSIKPVNETVAVYNFRVDPEHTYFAGGFYVHNEKGGGPRELFADAALFQSVQLDGSGRGRVTFRLPDNITSWRVTAQGISKNLMVGVNTAQIPVSLPVFAEVTIGSEYLTVDKPIARLRAYGNKLTASDAVSFIVEGPTGKSPELTGQAFAPLFYQIPEIKLGRQDYTYSVQTAKGKDAIKLPITGIVSRLQAREAKHEVLTPQTKITAENDLPLAVVLSDEGQNTLYAPLQQLSWSWTDRVDQKLASTVARQLLKDYYHEEIVLPDWSGASYQYAGGLTLLPYSSDDLELSAKIAASDATRFDRLALRDYFFRIAENKTSTPEQISLSLTGLAALGEPVLPRISDWLGARTDLPVKDKLYLAWGLAQLGAKEEARTIFYQVLTDQGETKDPYIIIRVSDKEEEVFAASAMAAAVGSAVQAPEAAGLFQYLVENQRLYGSKKNSENLYDLEKVSYIKNALPNLYPSPAKVVYQLFGREESVNLTGEKNILALQLDASQVDQLKFISVEGKVGVSTVYTKAMDITALPRDASLSMTRRYFVNGQETNTWREGDLVEVRLYPAFSKKALAGQYQLTDVLPSGLVPVTKLYSGQRGYDCHYWYPYNTDGQLVKFRLDRDWRSNYCAGDYIKYFARVKNRGQYKAEPALLQSYTNPEFLNYSAAQVVNITE